MSMFEVDYLDGMNLGLGYNTASLSVHPFSALENTTQIYSTAKASGQQVTFKLEMASSTLSISDQLNISARASLKFASMASGSAKVNFVNSFRQNSYTVYVLVQVHVTNEQTLLDLTKTGLTKDAAILYATNPKAFVKQHGDSFIYGLITGGNYFGVLEIESSSATEFREIKASLSGKANFGVYSGSASATMSQSLEKITSSYKMKASVLRDGGEGGLRQITADQLINDALNFPNEVLNGKGISLSALVVPYNHIPTPLSAEPISVAGQKDVLEQLGRDYFKFTKYRNDLQFALDNQNLFPGLKATEVTKHLSKVNDVIANIKMTSEDCYQNVNCNRQEDKIDYNLLDETLVPAQEKDTLGLGNEWHIVHGKEPRLFISVWKREGNSNLFRGKQTTIGSTSIQGYEQGEMTVYRSGSDLRAGIIWDDKFEMILIGKISEDEKTATGNIHDTSYTKQEFTASIVYS